MIQNIVYIEVLPSSTNHIVTRFPIGKGMTYLQEINRPNRLVFLFTGNTKIKFPPKSMAELIAPIDHRVHEWLDVTADIDIKEGLVVVTHIDVIPPEKDNGIELVKQMCHQSRTEPGCLAYNAYTQSNRPNHITVVENWQSTAAQVIHVESPTMVTLRTKLSPISGALYDERFYHLCK